MAVSAGGIRAGAAYVELFVQDNRLTRGLTAAAGKLKAFGASLMGIGVRVGAVGAAALAPVVPALETLNEQAKLASAADAFGLSAEKASRLFGLMQAGGSDVRDATEGLVTFNQRVSDALSGTGEEAAQLFRSLGVSAKEFAGLDSADRFYKLLDALRAVPDPAKRVQLLLKAVGEDTGKNLIPVLSMSEDEVRALGDAFEQSGADLQQARETNRAYVLATAQLSKVWREVVAAVAPAIRDLAEWVTRAIKPVIEWVRQNREAVKTAALIAAVVFGVGGALVALGAAVSLAGFAISGLVSLFSALGTVISVVGSILGALVSPIGLVVAALIGLGYLFVTQTDAGQQMVDELSAGFMSFAETAKTAWGGIVAAIQAGDLELAAKVALAAVNLEWAKAVLWWTEKWNAFKGIFVDGWHDVVAGLKLMFWDLTAWIARTFSFAIEKLFKSTAWVADKLGFETFARNLRENFDFSDENINRNRDRIKNQILDDRARRQREANAARRADAAGAMDDVKKAADELRDAVKEAERKRDAVPDRVAPKGRSGSMYSLDEVLDLSKKVDVQGTFNALAVRGLGGESINERTAKAVDQINDNVKKIAVAAVHGGLVFA
ncbi:MAG: phage tail tape measure protein [Planctomycetes bacterium]|nr:phage tail tape measure protein [Planctomycetota bacterium]